MTNIVAPHGFKPYTHNSGGSARLNSYTVVSGYNTAIYMGDPVRLTGAGKAVELAATDATDVLGIFWGCKYVDDRGDQQFSKYWPADQVASEIEALIYDDATIKFEVECNTLAEADIGGIFEPAIAAGAPSIGLSKTVLDVAGGAAAAGAGWMVVGLKPEVGNEYGDNAKAIVVPVGHVFK